MEVDSLFRQFFPATKAPSDSAFCQARAKIAPSAFAAVNQELVETFYQHTDPKLRTYKGFRLLALDGSTLRLPSQGKDHETLNHFGGMRDPSDGRTMIPMARMSMLYDVLGQIVPESIITPYCEGEESHALKVLTKKAIRSEDLIILDRGYFSDYLFAVVGSIGAEFLCRVPVKMSIEAQDFLASGLREQVTKKKLTRSTCELLKEDGHEIPKDGILKIRWIRVELETGEVEVLATSVSKKRIKAKRFGGIYHLRWGIEEVYKSFKHKVKVGHWSGTSVHAIYQDFHARLVLLNLAMSLAHASQKKLDDECREKECVHEYKINIKRAIGCVEDRMQELLMGKLPRVEELLSQLDHEIHKKPTIVRRGRTNRRRPRPQRIFSACYKRA